jgi:hypothetical protein
MTKLLQNLLERKGLREISERTGIALLVVNLAIEEVALWKT